MSVKRLALEGAGQLSDETDASELQRTPICPEEAEEVAWVSRAQKGDAAAQEALFRRYLRPIRRKLHRLLGPDADIEDVAQETFVSAFENLHALANAEAFGSWLHTIAVHAVRRRLRRRSLLRRLGFVRAEDQLAHVESVLSPALSPDAVAEAKLAYRALERMGVEARLAFVLRYVEGLTVPEIAQQMALSERTVKRRIAAARSELSKSLDVSGLEER